MEKIIEKTIEYLKKVPAVYQAAAFPLIFQHELLGVRRQAWQDKLDKKKKE
jgi:hypothetical protein